MGAQVRVTVWQHASDLDPAVNQDALAGLELPAGTDLLVLPEAFARDFGEPGSPLAPIAEPLDGPFVSAARAKTEATGAAVVAGMFEQSSDPERPFNTLVLNQPGSLTTYRKIHLYDAFGQRESDIVSAGATEPVVAEVAGLQVGLMTCYDLRFPELGRALSAAGAEVLVLPAAWVAGPGKVAQWQTLIRARAIENVAWLVAAAQPGPRYCGHSAVIAPTGDVVAEAGEGEELLTAEIDLDVVRAARERNPALSLRRM
ncbi:carbon-nitrogen hydrolase family protein [Nocardioides marmorisolisilvae]|uniref:Carbon-nitrogen hydrolase family protein n=1 Tax=Nocardioides marmorisolisilvae TaxID=1542737 RepID=A0A3N0E0U3_9ACTN|nr:carbon-nitrogen hydrolase family protein [Nocardioides marmorisolisilvae]RNL81396.1 carbon-nitrogen hydrolase family protein [Nocardioides marmorisolisilvae]